MKTKNIIRPAAITGIALLIPLLSHFPWSLLDFIVMGILVMTTGLIIELVITKVKGANQRAAIILVIVATFFLIWAQMAVGLIGKIVFGVDCLATQGVSEFSECAIEARKIDQT